MIALQHYLVTGGAGFIGSHLVDALLENGHSVTVLDDFSTGKLRNIEHRLEHPRFRLVRGSILDAPLVERLISQVDAVFHLAAVVGVKYVLEDPLRGMQVNIRGTETILEAASQHKRRVVLASSSETYGRSTQVPFGEEDETRLGSTSIPRWSYALAKLLDEQLALAYFRQKQLPTSAVRYFNSYGPRLDPRGYGSVVARFITQALTGQPLTVYGDGLQTRSFTFVEDTVRGTMAAMMTPEAAGMVFNIGNNQEITMLQLAQLIRDLTGSTQEIQLVPYVQVYGKDFDETRRRLPDPTRARDVLGFQAQTPLEEGIRRTIHWFEEHRDELVQA